MTNSVKSWLRNIFAKPEINDKALKRNKRVEKIRRDLSAGELYRGIEMNLEE